MNLIKYSANNGSVECALRMDEESKSFIVTMTREGRPIFRLRNPVFESANDFLQRQLHQGIASGELTEVHTTFISELYEKFIKAVEQSKNRTA